jgi:ankyrin repeat protein
MLACERRHLGVVRVLLHHLGKQELQVRDKRGKTALHYAASCGDEAIVPFLLGEGAQANSKDKRGATPLLSACAEGHMGVMKLFLQHAGPQALQEMDNEGRTALHHAAFWGHEEAVTFLLGQGAQADSKDEDGTTPFMIACQNGQTGVARLLLQHMGPQAFQETDTKGRTALHYAASWDKNDIVSFLLGQGAQANSRDEDSSTPFMMACKEGHMGVVKALLEHMGPEALQETDEGGRTALHFAAYRGHQETATFLLGQGARANSRDEDGCTPFMDACEEGHMGVVQMFLHHIGPEALRERDRNGMTALHLASVRCHGAVVRALLLAGADPTVTDHEGRTPRAIPQMEGKKEEKGMRAACVAAFEVRKRK